MDRLTLYRGNAKIGEIVKGVTYYKPNSNKLAKVLAISNMKVEVSIIDHTFPAADYIQTMDSLYFFNHWLPIETADKPVLVCKCGAKSTGAKDFTRQHSDWCDVYKA